ncbi:MAG: hypothetical protein KJO54_12100 [Gammaproteobacteria bacterium]|nr:hypothetical protein [Gammaproteobacteria bacterium]NNF62122.1 hypothetical protein [Gammaproteobacteria bacterium]
MNQYRLAGRGPSLITRVLTAIAGMLVLVGLFLAGLVAWVLLAGVVFIGSVALAIALWRQRRRMEKFRRRQGDGVIEVEYEVVAERRERD